MADLDSTTIAVAKAICQAHGYTPERLEAGDALGIDGHLPNHDPAHFMWREFTDEATAAVAAYRAAPLPQPQAGEPTEATALDDVERDMVSHGDMLGHRLGAKTIGIIDAQAAELAALRAVRPGEPTEAIVEDAHEIAGRLREIVQGGMDHHPEFDTDKQIYSAMHGQVLRLLEWDVRSRAALKAALSLRPVGEAVAPYQEPTLDEVKAAIRKGLTDNLTDAVTAEKWDADILHAGCIHYRGHGYAKPAEAADNLATDAARAVMALYAHPVQALPAEPGVKALEDVAAERERQKSAEGWTAEHDDGHVKGQLARAASTYAYGAALSDKIRSQMQDETSFVHFIISSLFPVWGTSYGGWGWEWFKPKDRRRDLVKAGALILAEIERLDRSALLPDEEGK